MGNAERARGAFFELKGLERDTSHETQRVCVLHRGRCARFPRGSVFCGARAAARRPTAPHRAWLRRYRDLRIPSSLVTTVRFQPPIWTMESLLLESHWTRALGVISLDRPKPQTLVYTHSQNSTEYFLSLE